MVNHDIDPHIERAIEAFIANNPDRLMAEMVEDATFTDPLEAEISGTELREYTAEIFEELPDVRLEVKRVISSVHGKFTPR